MIDAALAQGLPMIVAALRDPYDLHNLPETVFSIELWEYSKTMFDIFGRYLKGELTAEGVYPLSTY